MRKKWVIEIFGVLLIILGSFFYPDLARSERKIINFNAG
jgi:hypothetical protein